MMLVLKEVTLKDSGRFVYINVNDISVIDGNTIVMKSLKSEVAQQYATGKKVIEEEPIYHLVPITFVVTDESIKSILRSFR